MFGFPNIKVLLFTHCAGRRHTVAISSSYLNHSPEAGQFFGQLSGQYESHFVPTGSLGAELNPSWASMAPLLAPFLL